MAEISDAERVRCLENEIALRRAVYPDWIDKSKMTPWQAEREIAVMESILRIMRNLKRINERLEDWPE